MAGKPTYEELELRIKEVEKESAECRLALEALRESEERYRNLYDEAPMGYMEYDTEGRITKINRRELRMIGYSAEEMLGLPVWDFLVEKEVAQELIKAKLAGTKPPSKGLERNYRRKDGTTVPVLIDDLILKDKNGRIAGIRCAIQDITERKRIEEALKESEEKYRILFETSKDAIYITTPEGKLVEANQSHLDLFGYTKEERSGFRVADTYLNPDDRVRFRKEVEEKGAVKDFEVTLRKMDGTEIDCLITATVRRSREDGILSYQGIIRDVTERKRAQEEREKLIIELQDALGRVKTLSGLLPICSHCKKIRDDTGYWNRIETYVRARTEAEFSHSICPACAKKYYPEMNLYND